MRKYEIPENRFRNFYHLDVVSSTMDECENLIKSGVSSGIVVADSQTSGRGRNAKKWSSEANGNIYLSFFDGLDVGFIPQRCAVAAFSAVSEFVKNAEEVRIKWPNDILIGMKKVSGIIAKTALFNEKRFYICGIGVNLFHPHEPGMNFVWPPAALTDYAETTTEEVLCALIKGIDRAFSLKASEIIDVYGQNISWMINRKLLFSQDLIHNEKGEIAGFSDDFSMVKILTDDGLKELSALSVLSLD